MTGLARGTGLEPLLASKLPVLIEFWSPDCAYCKMIAPSVKMLAREFKGRVVVATVQVEANPDAAAKYVGNEIPVLVMLKGGIELGRFTGTGRYEELRLFVSQFVESP